MTHASDAMHLIRDFDRMPTFFISLVGSTDLWTFLSTTGGLTAGRRNEDHALFPYTTDDRVTENPSNTGPITLIRLPDGSLWQPFSPEVPPACDRHRNLYKSETGDRVVFEEIRPNPNLVFRYSWMTSPRFGLVRKAELENRGSEPIRVDMLDGVQNLLPAGATSQVQREFSNLLDGYKRSFREEPGTLALYTLSSLLTDLAEPSEALRATTGWSLGYSDPSVLLCSDQVNAFRSGQTIRKEDDVCARRGSYLLHSTPALEPGETFTGWQVFDTDADHITVISLQEQLKNPDRLLQDLLADLDASTRDLQHKMWSADGAQCTGDPVASTHHFTNVTFNCMRGGLFPDGPRIRRDDLAAYLDTWRAGASASLESVFPEEDRLPLSEFQARCEKLTDPDARRLCRQYLPLSFSRRHGDPSRPWNKFDIRVLHDDGSPRLDFQGNWRDLFQNLEALATSAPEFLSPVIATFLNATTLDGYNPYRVTRSGFEWEKPEPDNPWANIGYWSDHQIIYLQKLLEASEHFFPGRLAADLDTPAFSSADVPYRILPYNELVSRNDGTTVVFDWNRDEQVEQRTAQTGADGKLAIRESGEVHTVSLMEKLLILLLAKLGNFVPGGGIWMNTQRPEWNDANNALVGRGLSVVTLGYVHRQLVFLLEHLDNHPHPEVHLSPRVADWMSGIRSGLEQISALPCDDHERRRILDLLGTATTAYQQDLYANGPAASTRAVPMDDLRSFLSLARDRAADTLRANRRKDGLYHAYNVLTLPDSPRAGIRRLDPMLEGQVSILSARLLSPEESLGVLRALRHSPLYVADRNSYILYPDNRPPRFLDKNNPDPEDVNTVPLLRRHLKTRNRSIVRRDAVGGLHFHPDFRNARDLEAALTDLEASPEETAVVLDLYEKTFDHQAFTGRSGSMFSFEGLGSIYWHMVAKLLLAAQECADAASDIDPETATELRQAYADIRDGLGFRKKPGQFGAFPTDPYSHTPFHGGAKQPGMTGQVKEEILTRRGELGLDIQEGRIGICPKRILESEWRTEPGTLDYVDTTGELQHIDVPAHSFAFTCCRVPFRVLRGEPAGLRIIRSDDRNVTQKGFRLSEEDSRSVFCLKGDILQVDVHTG